MVTNSRLFVVLLLVNTEKDKLTYQEELMRVLDVILTTYMIAKRWTVLEGSDQLSLLDMKVGGTPTKN